MDVNVKMKSLKNKKGISPVISTLILTAVAVSISVTTSRWMGGLSMTYNQFEKIDAISATSSYDENSKMWCIELALRNAGTTQVLITEVQVNGKNIDLATTNPSAGNVGTDIPQTGVSINRGATKVIKVYIHSGGSGQPFSTISSRTIVLLKFVSSEGIEYPKACELCPP